MTQHDVFEHALRQAQQAADKAQAELETVRGKRDRYARFNPDKLEKELSNVEAMITQMERDIAARIVVHADLETDIRLIERKIRALFNPRNWFDRQQHRLRRERENLRARQRSLLTTNSSASQEMKHLKAKRAALRRLALEYAEATAENLDEVVRNAEQVHARSLASLSDTQARKDAFDEAIEPLRQQVEDFLWEINDLETKITIAQQYDRDLSDARNGHERAQLHKACEREIGYGRPVDAINAYSDKLAATRRWLEKSHARLDMRTRQLLQEIRHLIIDGNNMCYEDSRENSFVGLAPLQALLPKLLPHYAITLVFDATIRRQLNMNNAEIRASLPPGVTVHITATTTKADPLLLRLATGDAHAFIISNDRFTDFPDRKDTRTRLMRHEIVAGRVIIDDLDVDVPYE